jgi:hypothetical protein
MKLRNFIASLALIWPVSVQAQTLVGQSWSEVVSKKQGVLTVVYHSQKRLIYNDGADMKGLCVGILHDFVEFVQIKYGVVLKINYLENKPVFEEFLNSIRSSENVLGVANVSITPQRRKYFLFTPPFLDMPPVLVTHKSTPDIVRKEQLLILRGNRAIVIQGSSHEQKIRNIDKLYSLRSTFEWARSSEEIPRILHSKPNAYSVIDMIEYVNVAHAKQDIKPHKVTIGSPDPLGFIMSLKSDWQVVWNEFLTDDYKESAAYRKLILENLGQGFLKIK